MLRLLTFVLLCIISLTLSSGNSSPLAIPLGLDRIIPIPANNLPTKEKIELGEKLFFDTMLSRNSTVSCASCHQPENAFTDNNPVAIGIDDRIGSRRTPALINRAYGRSFSWDGRAESLEEQVLLPITNPLEMDMDLDKLTERLNKIPEYRIAFERMFDSAVTVEGIAFALSSFIRSLFSGNSPFDRYMQGEKNALSPSAHRGMQLFRGKARCIDCHVGPNFTDEQFHNTGVAFRDSIFTDKGRYLVTGNEKDTGAFKTPTLREVEHTAPYMHNGSKKTLKDVIEFYDRGGNPNPFISDEIQPLQLTEEEKQDLKNFLKTLSGDWVR